MTTETGIVIPQKLIEVLAKNEISAAVGHRLIETFTPAFAEAGDLCREAEAVEVTDATQLTEMKKARELRLALRAIRTGADKGRKTLKDESLRTGRAIDGAYNVLCEFIEPFETKMQEVEKFAERAEAARKAELHATRWDRFKAYADPAANYNFSEMTDAQFEEVLSRAVATKEAADKAEAERLEREKVERERLAEEARVASEENARLQAEAEAQRKALAEARAAEAREREARERAEREAADRAKREAEAKAKEAEAQRKALAEAAAAPDAEKLRAFARRVAELEVPSMATEAGKSAERAVNVSLRRLADEIAGYAEHL